MFENFTRAMEGRAVILTRLPSFVQPFFSPARPLLSRRQFAHLWSLVLAVVVNLRAAKLCTCRRRSRGRATAPAPGPS